MTEESKTLTPGAKRTAKEAAKANAEGIRGKLFIVTGAYSGLGVETVKALLGEGGKVVVGGRNEEKQKKFVEEMKAAYPEGYVDGDELIDLSNLESVTNFAKHIDSKYDKVDVLICNAGIMAAPAGVTKDGFEMQTGTNVIGHFLLAKILAPKTTRQVWLSSLGHAFASGKRMDIDYLKSFDPETSPYKPWEAYQQSKLGDLLLAKEFARRFDGLETASLNPGAINTNLGRHIDLRAMLSFCKTSIYALWNGQSMRFKSVEAGAATTVTAAGLPSKDLVIGGYYDDCEAVPEEKMIAAATNKDDAKALYDYCDEVTKKFQ